jgi:hypothetical protein
MRSRANDEGLLRPPCASVLSSASSGCVGKSRKGLGRIPRDLDGFAVAEGCVAGAGAGVEVDSVAIDDLIDDMVVGRRDATGVIGTFDWLDDVKIRLLHALSFDSSDSTDVSSRFTLSLRRLNARSRRTMPSVILGL